MLCSKVMYLSSENPSKNMQIPFEKCSKNMQFFLENLSKNMQFNLEKYSKNMQHSLETPSKNMQNRYMLKRKFYFFLKEWKKSKKNECLLVKGARQIGKSFIIRKFGMENYENYIEINFEESPEIKSAFEGNLNVDMLIQKITLLMEKVSFVPEKTLVFLDEIQSCPKARTSLKFWAEDGRFDVIASGSLLGLNYREVSSFPVGYERQVEMHSLDFEEFLWARGIQESLISVLSEHFKNASPVENAVNKKMESLVREYMAIGGMPAVVNSFIESNNYNEVHKTQMMILDAYLNDIAKYAPAKDKPKARNCYLSIPRQLSKENTKFQYGLVEEGGNARKYANSLDWLRDSNIVRYCFNVVPPSFPLVSYVRQEQFRIYCNDIGLLVAMFGYEMKSAIVNDTLKGSAKGGIYENLIADFLLKKDKPLFYFKRDDSSSEVEFLLEKDASVIPIEVKSHKGSTSSLDTLLKKEEIPYGYKIMDCNAGRTDKKITIPHYMAMFL